MTYHLTPARMAIIKIPTNNKYWRRCGGKGTLLHCWWECKLVQPLWKTVWRLLKKLTIELLYDPASTPRHPFKENHDLKKYMYPNVHCLTICNSQDMDAT
uniref:Uncharacterized protein n=2 Tax=Sus scrofa TaxID=9823 RepID=A0A8W4FB56_PIG